MKFYLSSYLESYDGCLENVEVIEEFNNGEDKYSVVKRNDGMEFLVLDYEGDDEFIWVSVGEDGDYDEVYEVD